MGCGCKKGSGYSRKWARHGGTPYSKPKPEPTPEPTSGTTSN